MIPPLVVAVIVMAAAVLLVLGFSGMMLGDDYADRVLQQARPRPWLLAALALALLVFLGGL